MIVYALYKGDYLTKILLHTEIKNIESLREQYSTEITSENFAAFIEWLKTEHNFQDADEIELEL